MTIRGKWAVGLLAVLAVSIAANLFVLGFVASAVPGAKRHQGVDRVIHRYSRRFPDGVRENVRSALEARRSALEAARDEAREARSRAYDLMRQEEFRREEVDRALAEMREKYSAVHAIGIQAVVEGVGKSSAEARAEITERRRRHRDKSWWKRLFR